MRDVNADHIANRYDVWFENVTTRPVRAGYDVSVDSQNIIRRGQIQIVSQGKYFCKPCGTERVSDHWIPGVATEHDFEIRDGKLKIDMRISKKPLIQRLLD